MIATITSKGQVTIPLEIRERLGLKAGDQIDFDEAAPILIARRVVDREAWHAAVANWRKASSTALKGHPWATATSAEIVDDLRGGPAES